MDSQIADALVALLCLSYITHNLWSILSSLRRIENRLAAHRVKEIKEHSNTLSDTKSSRK